MNYCCDKCGSMVKAKDLELDTDPRTDKKRWLCKDCKKKVKELRDQIDEAEGKA